MCSETNDITLVSYNLFNNNNQQLKRSPPNRTFSLCGLKLIFEKVFWFFFFVIYLLIFYKIFAFLNELVKIQRRRLKNSYAQNYTFRKVIRMSIFYV